MQQEPDGFEESTDPAFDDAVQSALIVGDYKGAVAQCISANKMADALVIANVGGASLWESTQDQYLKISRPPYLKVVYLSWIASFYFDEHMKLCKMIGDKYFLSYQSIINNVFIMSLSYMGVSFSGCFCNGEQWSLEPCKYKAPEILERNTCSSL